MTTADNDSDDGARSDTRSELVQLASYYDTHALRHRSASKRWFVAIVVVAIVGIGAGADSEYFVRDAASDVSLGQSLVLASANLVQIAMLSCSTGRSSATAGTRAKNSTASGVG